MKKFIRKKFGMRFKTITGILVVAPRVIRDEDVDFLLIGEDGIEYQLKGNKKTFQMWNLIDSRVEVSGIISDEEVNTCRLKTITFKCIDDFIDNDSLPISEFDFDVSRFDYAI